MIRTAVPEDAPAIGALKVRAWRAAYAGFMSPEFLDGLDPVSDAADWAEYLAELAGEHRLWVVQEGDSVAGFCRTGPADQSQDPDLGPRAAEVYGLYVEPGRIGTGLGHRLFGHAVTDLEGRGHGPLCVYAYVPNAPALRFYERAGFGRDGMTRAADEGGTGLIEARLVKPARAGGVA
ncbi:GNAT family N-acetyltransferase [Actinacidiphila glaucinigra]|uniref:Ribosomal protein S18 acetylase RimI n=1 Tax=Actinacidiphila glaucinigra TaxID=235986 RepID=A0A239GUA4_9ACTN|nr:GNAT family N-acetyltransferase [Actinacidiphila glaucinigra]SNS72368.1 Ribosomal protein S18 acetylase RimI [Actinacidiphila glaucinigra]